MRLLADESCDFRVVRALRAAGHDVVAIVEIAPGTPDEAVLALARRERRLFLTEDRDFGQLAYAAGAPQTGVILLRYPAALSCGGPRHPAGNGPKLHRDPRRKPNRSLRGAATGAHPHRAKPGGVMRRAQMSDDQNVSEDNEAKWKEQQRVYDWVRPLIAREERI